METVIRTKIKDLLVSEYGLDPARIVVIDAGTTVFSWRCSVEYPDGTEASRDNGAMQKNRVVAIIPESDAACMAELRNAGLVE